MSKISIKNASEELLDIEVVRYFENNDNEYLIYSLNETVGDGYIKLYASKIVGNKARIITDDDEWGLVKEIVKNIIKTNHEGLDLTIYDLNEEELEDITLEDTRVFKLQGNLVNLLSDNKHIKEPEVEQTLEENLEENIDEEELEEPISIDYKELYEDLLDKNKELNEKIEELDKEIDNYRELLSAIKQLIEE